MNARRIALLMSGLSIITLGGATVACSPRTENPAPPETSVNTPPVSPTEKDMRTNVTRSPMVAVPGGGAGGNPAVPCGFGPAGGGPCTNRN